MKAAAERSRLLVGIVFTLSVAICCLVAGVWVGATFIVTRPSGLAGPVIVLGYGVLAAVGGIVVAVILAIRLPMVWLWRLTVPFAPVGLVLFLMAGKGFLVSRAEQQAYLQQAYKNLPVFQFRLTHEEAATRRPFVSIEFDSGTSAFGVTRSSGSLCTGQVEGADKVELLTALRNVEGLLLKNPDPCKRTGPVLSRLSFRIEEAMPPNSAGDLALDEACLADNEVLRAAIAAAHRVYQRNQSGETCK